MSVHEVLYIVLFWVILLCSLFPLGTYMAAVFEGRRTILHPVLGVLEKLCYVIGGINPSIEMNWLRYTKSLVGFNFLGFIAVFLITYFQHDLPLNPQGFHGVNFFLAFNIACSFVTNTDWQSYAGETSLAYSTQMMGLGVQNFLSAATGNCVLLALIRGLNRKNAATIGNFWTDLVRTIVYLLLPLALILSLGLMTQGVIQSFSDYREVITLEGESQMIPMGPVASQVAIKQLGSNGGGFFYTNSSHPFENPTGISNMMELLAIFLIPVASVYMYGLMIKSKVQSFYIFIVMFFLWTCSFGISWKSEQHPNPVLNAFPLMEGKEVRLGMMNSVLWSVSTTTTSNGSTNSMLSSLSPLAGGVALFNMMLDELIFGGIGVGLCSMLMYIFLTVFLAGLMVGRTPEYLGKKIEKKDIQWVAAAILIPSGLILIGSSIATKMPSIVNDLSQVGPHGLTEILYAFSSVSGNNGSAFGGMNANTNFLNIILGLLMIVTRLAVIIPCLAIAGNLASKRITPPSIGSLPTNNFLFALLLICVILIVGALTFFPALSLGPIIEHYLMLSGRAF